MTENEILDEISDSMNISQFSHLVVSDTLQPHGASYSMDMNFSKFQEIVKGRNTAMNQETKGGREGKREIRKYKQIS